MQLLVNIEIVTGFLGAGKTNFINTLVNNTLVKGEKLFILQCEKGEKEILDEIKNNPQVILKDYDPQTLVTKSFINSIITIHAPHRIIIEHNGSRRLEELLKLFDEKELKKICKVSSIYNITDAATYEIFVSNMGNIILDSIYNSDLILLNNKASIQKEKLDSIIKQLEKLNTNAYIIPLNNILEIEQVLREKNILFGGYLKKINIFMKNFLK